MHLIDTLKYILISFSGAVPLTSGFIVGAGQIWLDDVLCIGTESRLADCPARPLGQHNCAHVEDAGVTCLASQTTTTPPPGTYSKQQQQIKQQIYF